MKILILLSGGLDSTVVLADLVRDHACETVGYDYGQSHGIELERAEAIAAQYCVPFTVEKLPPMPLVNDVVFSGRNLVLVSHAIAKAQSERFGAVAVGCNASDWMRFPDCRPSFWKAVSAAAEAYEVKVLTPLIYHDKRDVMQRAKDLKVPVDLTWSCYNPQGSEPCGVCLACEMRKP